MWLTIPRPAFRLQIQLAAIAAAGMVVINGCAGGADPSHTGVASGSALQKPFVTMTIDHVPFPVGQVWDNTFHVLVNGSKKPITLRRAVAVGKGVGRVIRVLRIWTAPIGAKPDTVPEALFHTLPPVFYYSHSCSTQRLLRFSGTVIQPGKEVHVLTLLRAERPGRLTSPGYDVYYTQSGRLYRQFISIGYAATVRRGAAANRLEKWETPCIGHAGSKLLPPLTRS
jgi:hypothetical protein